MTIPCGCLSCFGGSTSWRSSDSSNICFLASVDYAGDFPIDFLEPPLIHYIKSTLIASGCFANN